jgi:TP901 family phage tail tape measure protein
VDDDEAIAMEFAADVEEAVAGVQELAGAAQDLAETAQEAQAGVIDIGAAGAEAAGGIEEAAAAATEAAEEMAAYSDEAKSAAAAAGDMALAQAELKAASADARDQVAQLAATQATAGKDSDEYAAQLDVVAAAMDRQATAAAALKDAQEQQAAASATASDAAEASATAQEGAATATAAAGDAQEASAAKTDTATAAAAGGGLGKYKTALLGIGIGAGVAVDGAVKFRAENTRLVTSAGESAKNLGMVSQGMLTMSGRVDESTSELSSGMYLVESAGFHGAQGLTVLKAAAQGAKDESADLATVANGVTDALVDFHLPASDAANVTSQLIAAVSHGKTTFEEFSGSMSTILPLASSLHLKLSDVTGVLAEMTAHGMSARQAADDEANAMSNLLKPTATMSAEYAKFGLTSKQVQDSLGTRGLAGTMQWFSGIAQESAGKVGQTYTQAMADMIGSAAGTKAALMVTGENAKATQSAIQGISSATADAKGNVAGFGEVSQTAAFKLDAAKESAEAMGISLGEALLPAVTAVLGPITSFLQLVASNRAASYAFALVVGGILTVALGGKLVGACKDAKEGVTMVVDGIGKLVTKVRGLGTAQEAQAAASDVSTASAEAQTAATEALTVAKEAQTGATEALTGATEASDAAMAASPAGLIVIAIVALIAIIVLLVTHWKDVTKAFDESRHDIAEVFDGIRHDIAAAVDGVVSFVKQHWQLLATILATVLLGPVGGLVVFLATHWKQVEADVSSMVTKVVSFFRRLPGEALHELDALPGQMVHAGESIVDGLISGVENKAKHLLSDVGGLAHDVEHAFTDPLSIFSPSRVMAGHGQNVVLGIAQGVGTATPELIARVTAMGQELEQSGVHAIEGLSIGMASMEERLRAVVEELADLAQRAVADKLEIQSPSRVMFRHGANSVQGYIDGVRSKLPQLQSLMGGTASTYAASAVAPATGPASVHVTVPVTATGTTGDIFQSPQYQQALQAAVQEATLRYAALNGGSGLAPTWGRG